MVGPEVVQHTEQMDTAIPPGSVIVAVDGSVHAERAVVWATEQADIENRRLIALTATRSAMGTGPTAGLEDGERGARFIADEAAALASAGAKAALPATDAVIPAIHSLRQHIIATLLGDAPCFE